MHDPAAFEEEQAKLGRIWTFLGLTTDIPKENDWFRATLGGRSIFVQRFGDEIRGFENVCPHRFFPLRTADQGNGVIRCGFHHWQFNKEGCAVGIPHCKELFGKTPRELDVRLSQVEISTCGALVFGRFQSKESAESLEEFLGDGFTVIQAMFGAETSPHRTTMESQANWRLLTHISLDEYHLVAVHPSTFGKYGYLGKDVVKYFRIGPHNAYLAGTDDGGFERVVASCREGTPHPQGGYGMIQIFPNSSFLQVRTAMSWYVVFINYLPVAHDRTLIRVWFAPAHFRYEDRSWVRRLARKVLEPWLPPFVRYYLRKVLKEDSDACEKSQRVVRQIDGAPILGRHEERIGWFEEAYEEAMRGRGP